MFVLLLVALASVGTAIVGDPPSIIDEPYTELVSGRYTCADEVVAGWGQLPLTSPTQVLTVDSSKPDKSPAMLIAVGDSKVMVSVMPESRSGRDPGMQSGGYIAPRLTWRVVEGLSVPEHGRLVSLNGAASFAIIGPAGIAVAQCADASNCAITSEKQFSFGNVNDATAAPNSVWIACSKGLVHVQLGGSKNISVNTVVSIEMNAVAYSSVLGQVSAGNAEKVWFVDASAHSVTRWEWVTIVATGKGGVFDDVTTALAYDDVSGILYAGNPSALNVVYPNGTVERVGGLDGLPMANMTRIAVQSVPDDRAAYGLSAGRTWLLIGTLQGVARAEIRTGSESGARRIENWSWTYLFEARWLPGPTVVDIAAVGNTTMVLTTGSTIHGRDGCGMALLEQQEWTLAQKATRMQAIQARHSRLGMVGECSLSSFGNISASSCENKVSDNNGLWTSFLVVAESLRAAVTKSPAARKNAMHYLGGMKLLEDVTGIAGLMARSAIPPGVPRPASGEWHNSTAKGFAGYQWKGDASSDEVVGHVFGLQGMLQYFPWEEEVAPFALRGATAPPYNQSDVADALLTITRYIAGSGWTLPGIDGNPTTWGHWEPELLNGARQWSDQRGINSLQMLGFLAAGMAAADKTAPPSPSERMLLHRNWTTLCNDTNTYDRNTLNLKIVAPSDDNYSDDELTFLMYYALLVSPGLDAAMTEPIAASLDRTWNIARPLRSDLWNAIRLAVSFPSVGAARLGEAYVPPPSTPVTTEALADMRWNLQTWPLELIEWPVMNSQRLDIRVRPTTTRTFQHGGESTRILPANERPQWRWNSNPHDMDGGDGLIEMDAGAWLLPYWMARAHGLLQ